MSISDEKDPLDKYEANDHIDSLCTNPDFLTVEECNKIIESGKDLPASEGYVDQNSNVAGSLNLYTRSTIVRWLDLGPDTAWLFEKIGDAINYANCKYQFNLDYKLSRMQLATYSVGGHYNWHSDIGAGAPSYRKLSITIQLSDPDDYNGGDLEFFTGQHNVKDKLRKQGSATIFPSYLGHRVTIVTKGNRWSIVAWVCGPPFR